MSEWLSTSEAGKLIGVSSATVTRMCKSGRLDYIMTPGGQRRIHREEMVRYRESVTVKRPTPLPPPTVLPAPGQTAAALYARIKKRAKAEL